MPEALVWGLEATESGKESTGEHGRDIEGLGITDGDTGYGPGDLGNMSF